MNPIYPWTLNRIIIMERESGLAIQHRRGLARVSLGASVLHVDVCNPPFLALLPCWIIIMENVPLVGAWPVILFLFSSDLVY